MKFSALSATAVLAMALPAIDAFAIKPLTSLVSRSSSLVKRQIYDMPEVSIAGLSWNSSSTPSFDSASQTVGVDGVLDINFNFTATDDATVFDSINVQGYYVYGGGNTSDVDNKTQIACGSVSGPISVNSSQPFQVPITLQVSNVSLEHPILVDIASLCLGSEGGELTTVWGGWLSATIQNETYRCPLDKTNLTIPCPAPTLGASPGESGSDGNATCSFVPEDPLPSTSSVSSEPTEFSETSSPTSSPTSSEEPVPAEPTESSTASESTTVIGTTSAEDTTTDITTPTPTESTTVESTVTPTESTTVSPGVTIATPTPTVTDGTTVSQIPVIVTVTETATAARRRRQF